MQPSLLVMVDLPGRAFSLIAACARREGLETWRGVY